MVTANKRFTLFAELGPLGHEAQAVEVHVRAAQDHGHEGLALALVLFSHVLLDGRPRPWRPEGSMMLRVSWNTSLMAAQTSSVSTTT